MQDITVKRVTLLDELKKNRDRHRTVLHDAMLGYRQQAMLELREQLAKLEAGVVPSDLGVSLTRPASHTADYDRVIGMIEMHTGDEIELDETSIPGTSWINGRGSGDGGSFRAAMRPSRLSPTTAARKAKSISGVAQN